MTAVVRGWLGFCALGAGLIHLALAIGSQPAVGIPLLAIGAAESAWGVFAFTAPALPLPQVARAGALVPLLGWAVALVVTGGSAAIEGLRVLPMLVASLLDLTIAIGITGMLRREPGRAAVPLRPGRFVVALGTGALVVTALTLAALAATEAGFAAIPHAPGEEPFELILPGMHGPH
jgi:hypothetical protein